MSSFHILGIQLVRLNKVSPFLVFEIKHLTVLCLLYWMKHLFLVEAVIPSFCAYWRIFSLSSADQCLFFKVLISFLNLALVESFVQSFKGLRSIKLSLALNFTKILQTILSFRPLSILRVAFLCWSLFNEELFLSRRTDKSHCQGRS